MAITNGNFFGEIVGRNIYSFLGELNYELTTSTERIEHLKKVLYTEQGYPHPFFERLFEQTYDKDTGMNTSYIKLILNTTDELYTNSNVCDVLRKMADYVLFTQEGRELNRSNLTQYKIYKDARMFEKIQKELSLEAELERVAGGSEEDGDIDTLIHILVKDSNHRKEKGTKIVPEDFNDPELGNIIKGYQNQINYMRAKLEKNKEIIYLIENFNKLTEEQQERLKQLQPNLRQNTNLRDRKLELIRECKNLSIHIHSMRQDMIDCKEMIKKPIVFKSLLDGHPEPDYDDADLTDEAVVRELILLPEKDVYDLQDDYDILQYMVNEMSKEAFLTKQESRILELIRAGHKQADVADVIMEEFGKCGQYTVSRAIDTIVGKIAWCFEDSIEAFETGRPRQTMLYKVCKTCEEEKAIVDFDKEEKGKYGRKAHCKCCRKEKKEKSNQ